MVMTENIFIYIYKYIYIYIHILHTNVMIRLHKYVEITLYKVGNNDISLSKSFWSKFFGMHCIISCFHVLGSFLFINIMLNNPQISLPYSPQLAFMSSYVVIINNDNNNNNNNNNNNGNNNNNPETRNIPEIMPSGA